MITLTAKINLLSGDNKALSLGSTDLSGNNISRHLSTVVGSKTKGSNPFIIGASKLGDGSTFSDGEDYFIGDKLSDEFGAFETPFELEIRSAKPLNSISISFDTIKNRHPTVINIVEKAKKEYPYNIYCDLVNKYGLFYGAITLPKEIAPNNYNIYYVKYFPENEELTAPEIRKDSQGNFIVTAYGYERYSYQAVDVVFELENEISHIDNDSIFTVANLNGATYLCFYIYDWNTPKYPLVITGIYAEADIDIDYRNLISISRSIFDRSDLKLPSFGIISNTGNIEFNDNSGEIRDYAEQLLLQSGLSCEIKLNNTLVEGASETIGLFETDQWNYENDSRVVSVSIKDDLEEWQDINVAAIEYDPRVIEHKPFSWLYEHLWKLTSNREAYVNDKGETIIGTGNYNMLSIVELDEDTQAVLNNTYIQYPLLESGSLWQQWTKLCQVCQLHIYKNNNGVIVCRYNGGN